MTFDTSEAAVRYGKGIRIHTASGRTIIADGSTSPSDVTIVSHAHSDHLVRSAPPSLVCSTLTAKLAKERTGIDHFPYQESTSGIELIPSGHIVGSRAAVIEDESRYLYTGDVCMRDRLHLNGFKPVNADVLIIESTYGLPMYEFPPQDQLEAEIIDWIEDNSDHPLLLFGYPLGRSQKLLQLARKATVDRVLVHERIQRLNTIIETVTPLSFSFTEPYSNTQLEPGDVFVLPSTLSRAELVEDLVNRSHALKAGFSGWAIDDSFRYRGGFDSVFPLSDHSDFPELLEIVKKVDPEIVFTHHGFDEALAKEITSRLHIDARPLKRDQTTLADF